jgi:phospholipid transport system substrate-binding protein
MFRKFIGIALILFSSALLAQETPDALVKSVTSEVIDVIKQDKAIQAGDQKRILQLVEEKILKHFDFSHMTALAMGREWKNALTTEFRTLLVRSYSNALSQYKNQTIDFKPLKMQPNDTDVIVRSEVKQPGAKPIGIDYEMSKAADGWKVYDVMVAGVSLVTNYRETFTQEVRTNGVDGLIKTLREKNKQLEGTKKS